MVRLMLVLAPVMCVLGGIGMSAVLTTYMKNLDNPMKKERKSTKKIESNYPLKNEVSSRTREHLLTVKMPLISNEEGKRRRSGGQIVPKPQGS